MEEEIITVEVATEKHLKYVDEILKTIEDAAKVRGTGIAKRRPEYVASKIQEGKAVIAMCGDDFAGFCYIESWGHEEFVANSGLIVKPEYRQRGLAKKIKHKAFELSRQRFPNAKIFGLTAGLPVTLEGLVGNNGKVFGLNSFGFSAPYTVLDEKLGFNAENVYNQVKEFLN